MLIFKNEIFNSKRKNITLLIIEMDSKGYYKLLGVNEDASQDEIKSKYKKLALKYHPDKQANKSEKEKKEA